MLRENIYFVGILLLTSISNADVISPAATSTTADTTKQTATEAGDAVSTLDCSYEWTNYSECFTDVFRGISWRDRMASIKPGFQTGATCNVSVNRVQTESCSSGDTLSQFSSTNCQESGSSNEWFRCGNGRCIRSDLTCNGDDDCGDATDEYPMYNSSCYNTGDYICGIPVTTSTSTTAPRSERYFTSIPSLESFSLGFDLLRGMFVGEVLSMRPFGSCRRVLKSGESDVYYRLPNNVNSFSQTLSTEEGAGMTFRSAAEITDFRKYLLSNAYRMGGTLEGNDSAAGMTQSSRVQTMMMTEMTSGNKYFGVSTNLLVRIFEVTLKGPSYLELSNSFIQRLFDLPHSNYSYQRYMAFIQEFGTHYVTSGSLGGQYEQMSVYDSCQTLNDATTSYDFEVAPLKFQEKILFCEKQALKIALNPQLTFPSVCMKGTTNNLVADAVSQDLNVMGGSVSTIAALKQGVSSATMQAWMTSVVDHPVLIPHDFQLQRISSLLENPLPQLTVQQRIQIKEFLDRAIDDYLRPYDATSLCEDVKSNCDEYCGQDSQVQNEMYLMGTGGEDYRCLCACAGLMSVDTCRGGGLHASLIILLSCMNLSWWILS